MPGLSGIRASLAVGLTLVHRLMLDPRYQAKYVSPYPWCALSKGLLCVSLFVLLTLQFLIVTTDCASDFRHLFVAITTCGLDGTKHAFVAPLLLGFAIVDGAERDIQCGRFRQ